MDGYRSSMCFCLKGGGRRKKKNKYLFLNYYELEGDFGEGNGTPLQYSCLENPMDRGARWAAWGLNDHGVVKSRTRLSDFTFTFHFHALEEEMATHSSVLAWRIPGIGEPGGLPHSTGSHRVGHDWSDLAAAAAEGDLKDWLDFGWGPKSLHSYKRRPWDHKIVG